MQILKMRDWNSPSIYIYMHVIAFMEPYYVIV